MYRKELQEHDRNRVAVKNNYPRILYCSHLHMRCPTNDLQFLASHCHVLFDLETDMNKKNINLGSKYEEQFGFECITC